jgi:hypothetical protein
MRKLRLSIFLPATQIPVALMLWECQFHLLPLTHSHFSAGPLICYGINAPALFLRLAVFPYTRGNHPSWPQPTLFGFGLEEFSFFLGIAILWYLIGKWLDKRALNEPKETLKTNRELMIGVFLAVAGLLMSTTLLIEGTSGLRIPFKWGDYWGSIIESVLFLVWSIVLFSASGVKVMRVMRLVGVSRIPAANK